MIKIKIDDIPITGLPLYEKQVAFSENGNFSAYSLSLITLLPGQRVPLEGTGRHEEDEYSIFLEGEVYTECGEYKGICKQGEATFIPKGEAHWSENRTDKPCKIVCLLVK